MDIPKIIRKLFGLAKIARGQAGTPEGDNAQRMVDVMLERHPLNLPQDGLVRTEVRVPMENDYDRDLAALLSKSTNTEAYVFKTTKEIRFSGIKVCVDEAVKHYTAQRATLERLTAFTVLGYLMGSFGEEAIGEHIKEAAEVSKTVETGLEEAKEQAEAVKGTFDEMPTDEEEEMVGAAASVGARSPLTLWEGLKK
jgi:hypothetical protein